MPTARETRIADIKATVANHRRMGNTMMANIMEPKAARYEGMTDAEYDAKQARIVAARTAIHAQVTKTGAATKAQVAELEAAYAAS